MLTFKVRAARNKYAYFAHELHAAMAGLGTRDDDLIRLLVSKSEVVDFFRFHKLKFYYSKFFLPKVQLFPD
jgi:hypothetical protein